MEFTESILDSIHEEPSLDSGDVEMMDVEEGEVVDGRLSENTDEVNKREVKVQPHGVDDTPTLNMNKNKRGKKKKKKSKKRKGVPGSIGVNIDRFVWDVCKQLRERKTFLVYTAVGILGVSAVSDLVKEVDAIQACGGQKTANGNQFRKGGGILWNILKTREPNAFKEIMKRGKEFEKQLKHPGIGHGATKASQVAIPCKTSASTLDVISEVKVPGEEEPPKVIPEDKRKSVHERIKIPVSYDDLVGEEQLEDHKFPNQA